MTDNSAEREEALRVRGAVERRRLQAAEARRQREDAMREHQERTALMRDIRLMRDDLMPLLDQEKWPLAKEMRKRGLRGGRLHVYPLYSIPSAQSDILALLGTDGKLYVSAARHRLREIDFKRVEVTRMRSVRYGLEEAIRHLGGAVRERSY